MTNKEIVQKIKDLLAEYKMADLGRQVTISHEVRALYKQLPHRAGYCYNCNMHKSAPDVLPFWPFCGSACQEEWGKNNYGENRPRTKKTVEEMKQGLLRMAKEEHLKKLAPAATGVGESSEG